MARPSWHLSRRTFLRGAGVAVATLSPRERARRPRARPAPRRLVYVYFNGCSLLAENDAANRWRWFPSGEGKDWQFTDVLKPLEHRERGASSAA